jgi:hypothetical protein
VLADRGRVALGNQEVRRSGAGRDAKIVCLVVDGEPRARSGCPPERECLPPALLFTVENSVVRTAAPEPLAADLRPGRDGRRDAKLKIIAGLLGWSRRLRRATRGAPGQLAAISARLADRLRRFAGLRCLRSSRATKRSTSAGSPSER